MNLKAFGKTLQNLRKGAGFTQQDLADELQVSTDLISKWERGYSHRGRTWKPDRKQMLHLIYMFEDRLTETKAQQWGEQLGYKFSSLEVACLVPPQQSKPHQAPPLPTFHVDRQPLQQKLEEKLKDTPVLVLHGAGGVGKTTLAAWAGQKLAANFSDGVIWVEANSENQLETAQSWLAQSLGLSLSGRTSFERAAELRTACHGKKYLLIIDDVYPIAELRLLHIVTPPARLLITTRNGKVADLLNAPLLEITSFLPVESRTFFRQWVPPDDELKDVELLTDRLGHLPLALSLSGAQVRAGITVRQLLAAFDNHSPDLTLLDLPPATHRNESLIASFDISYHALTPTLQDYFAQLGYLSSPFSAKDASSLWQLPLTKTSAILSHMHRMALVEKEETEYLLQPLLHDYARLKLVTQQR